MLTVNTQLVIERRHGQDWEFRFTDVPHPSPNWMFRMPQASYKVRRETAELVGHFDTWDVFVYQLISADRLVVAVYVPENPEYASIRRPL
jgi:hypothetical protein